MKKAITTLGIAIAFITSTKAQISEPNNGIGMGFQLNEYQNDFGIGLNLTSPYFANKKVAFRLRGNLMFHEHIQDLEYTWTPYSNLTFGVVATSGVIANFVRLYGEGGIIALLPDDNFSDEDFVTGGYGLFGFEFFMSEGANYFIEIGGVGTGARADNVIAQPIYSNGLSLSTGFRYYL